MDLFSLNIITCVVLAIISLAIFSVTLNEMNNKFDFKVSTCLMIKFWGVVGIMTFFLIMAGIPFDNFKTTHQTQYTSFTITELSDKTTTVTVREKNGKEKTYKFDKYSEVKDSSFKGFGVGKLVYQTSTTDFKKWREERKNGVN